jgi:hypothetical protein
MIALEPSDSFNRVLVKDCLGKREKEKPSDYQGEYLKIARLSGKL